MKRTYLLPTGEKIEAPELPPWKTPFNHDTNLVSDLSALYCADESRTQQQFKDDADINVILQRFMKTGEPPPFAPPEAFMDATNKLSYFEMQSRIAEANALFHTLPAQRRAEFQNDPNLWAEACVAAVDTGDRETATKLGIELKQKPQDRETATKLGIELKEKPQEPKADPGGSPAPETPKPAPGAPKD